MTNVAIIQARMTSTRLPGKVLADICGSNSLSMMVHSLKHSKALDSIVIATSIETTDDPIVRTAQSLGVDSYRGSLRDVRSRFLAIGKNLEATNIVRLTADCPLIDASIVDRVIQLHESSGADYTSNTLVRTFPRGLDTEVFKRSKFEELSVDNSSTLDLEHVTPFFYDGRSLDIHLESFEGAHDFSELRWTLDYKEDLEYLRFLIKYFKTNHLDGFEQIISSPGFRSIPRNPLPASA